MPKRRVLLVDDEVTVLLTMKAVLEIAGFDVDTAASAREGKSRIKLREYQMVITDMRMESDASGREVIQAARTAPYHPAVALLTAYPDDDFTDLGADKVLVKARHVPALLNDLENLLAAHSAKLTRLAGASAAPVAQKTIAPTKNTQASQPSRTSAAKPRKSAAKRLATKKLPQKKTIAASAATKKTPARKTPAKKR